MKLLFSYSIFLLFLCGLGSFKKKEAPTANPNVTFKADLHQGNEADSSTAIGTATLVFNTTTKIFSLKVIYTGQTVVSGYIHNELPGMMTPVMFPLSDVTSPITYTSAALNASQEAELNANRYVINLYSPEFSGGKICAIMIKEEYGNSSPPPPPGEK